MVSHCGFYFYFPNECWESFDVCNGLHVYVPLPPKFTPWNPSSLCDGITRWAFEMWLGPGGESLMNRISAIIKETPRVPLPSAMQEDGCLWSRKQALTRQSASTRILDFPASTTMRNKLLLFITPPTEDDGWMTSMTQWTWVWVNSGSWWRTGRPGVLQFMGLQRVGHNWATELNWT